MTCTTAGKWMVPSMHSKCVPCDTEGLIDLDISRKGGHVVWMLDNRTVGETNLSVGKAVARAADFLAERGMSRMQPTWSSVVANGAIVPFAFVQDDIVVYPDLVKVTVALDNGEIIGYEALGYLMSHHPRDLPEPALTETEARQRVSDLLSTGEGRLALIPLETLEEVLTWEFPAELDGDPYIVYVNAVTGDEEQILKLLTTEEGPVRLVSCRGRHCPRPIAHTDWAVKRRVGGGHAAARHLLAGLGAGRLFVRTTPGHGLRRWAGRRMRLWLARPIANPWAGFAVGCFVTAAIQSSSATNVLVFGLVPAVLPNLPGGDRVFAHIACGWIATTSIFAHRQWPKLSHVVQRGDCRARTAVHSPTGQIW